MKIRYILLLTFAVFIDFLQVALGWTAFAIGAVLQGITPAGGAAAGAAAGAYACYNSAGGVIQGIVDATKCGLAGGVFGAAASAFGVPIGIALGFVFDIVITLTFGSALVMTLILLGMYSPIRTWSNYLLELIPGLDVLPGWTLMVILSIWKDLAKKDTGAMGKVAKLTTVAAGFTNPLSAMRSATAVTSTVRPAQPQKMQDEVKPRTPQLQNIPRPANDNQPYVQKAA